MSAKFILLIFVIQVAVIASRKVNRCGLAKDLVRKYHIPKKDIPTWMCIVKHESNFDTKAENKQSHDHGLFQISQLYWCDPVMTAKVAGCGTTCAKFKDGNIDDDVKCVKKIFDEFQKREGNGFKAWTTYNAYCLKDTAKYVQGCHY